MTRKIALAGALFALAICASSAAAATSGPVGYWKLNEGAGNVALDSSGYGDDGTVMGGAHWVTSPTGGALSFDGETGAVRIPNAPQLQPTSAVTVSAWIARSGSPGTFRYVLAKGAASCIAATYGLYSGPNGGLQFYVSRDHGTVYARSPDAGQGVWDGNWHLVVGTFDGTTVRLYVDGVQVGTGTVYPGDLEYVLPNSNDLYIGDYAGCNAKNFLGTIADVQIWGRALAPDEVANLSQSPAQPTLPPLASTPTTPVVTVPAVPATGPAATNPPVLQLFKLSDAITSAAVSWRQLLITYTDSQPARVTFTILKQAPKRGCVTAKGRKSKPATGCSRYIRLRSFTHNDRAGRNVLHFPAGLRLVPGSYVLQATPNVHGVTGRTISIAFTVLARHAH